VDKQEAAGEKFHLRLKKTNVMVYDDRSTGGIRGGSGEALAIIPKNRMACEAWSA
jgi:hypothetical protein